MLKIKNKQGIKELSFLLLFLVFFYFLSILFVPDFFVQRLIQLTAYLVVSSAQLFGLSSIYKGDYVLVSGFLMRINFECSAFYIITIFVGATIAYPKHNIKYKAVGVVVGTALIILMNALRIMLLGYIGAEFPEHFEFVHTYIWEGLFTLLVVALWFLWVNRIYLSYPFALSCGVGLLVAGAVIAGLDLIMEDYLRVLSWTAEELFEVIGNADPISIYVQNNNIVYIHGGKQTLFRVSVAVFDSAIFFALIFASFRYSKINKRIGQVILCTIILIMQHLVFIMFTGYLIIQESQGHATTNILPIMRGISIAMPVLLWIMINRKEINKFLMMHSKKH